MSEIKNAVLVVERDLTLANLYSSIIGLLRDYDVKGIYSNCYEACKHIGREEPSVLLVSVDMPSQNHLNEFTMIRKDYKWMRIVVQLNFIDVSWVEKAMENGADSFILKSDRLTDIERAFNNLSFGGAYFSPEIVMKLVLKSQRSLKSPLSHRETEVLQLMADGKTYSMIADELGISSHTSRAHIKNIYSKLSVAVKAEAIRKAYFEKLI